MSLNRKFVWITMTLWISRELPYFNFECLDISWASIVHPCQIFWPLELDPSFRVQFRASRYILCLNRTSEWKVMTIWIFGEHPLFNFECLDTPWASIIHPCQKFWPSLLDQSFRAQFRASRYIMWLNWKFEWNVMMWILRGGSFDTGYEGLDDATSGEGR